MKRREFITLQARKLRWRPRKPAASSSEIPRISRKRAHLAEESRSKEPHTFAAGLIPVVQAIRDTGATTLRDISFALNERGIRSARGGRWYPSSVANLLARGKLLEAS